MNITIVDPLVDKNEVFKKTGLIPLESIPRNKKYTLIIFSLCHKEFEQITKSELLKISCKETRIIDLTNKLSGENIFNL